MPERREGYALGREEWEPNKPFTETSDHTSPFVRRIHGEHWSSGKSFNCPFISEILPGLYLGGTSTGLVLPQSVGHVVSLYQGEEYTVRSGHVKTHVQARMDDKDFVDEALVDLLARWVRDVRNDTSAVLVACQAGLNRSSLIVARALMIGPEHMTADEAINLIRDKRSWACLCNETFEGWLRQL